MNYPYASVKDYRKLNTATQKDHFPLPFINQILETLELSSNQHVHKFGQSTLKFMHMVVHDELPMHQSRIAELYHSANPGPTSLQASQALPSL